MDNCELPENVKEVSKDVTTSSVQDPSSGINTSLKLPLNKSKISLVKEVNDYSDTFAFINEKKIRFLDEKIPHEKLKYHKQFNFKIEPTKFGDLMLKYFSNFGELLSLKNYEVLTKYEESFVLIRSEWVTYCSFIDIDIFSDNMDKVFSIPDNFKIHIKDVLLKTDIGKCDLSWYLKIDGRTRHYNMLEYLDDIFYSESYPYIDCDKFIDDYLKSEAPVLVLIGPPGTGKTKLIRQIIREVAVKEKNNITSVLFTSSREIIEQGQIYLDLLFGEYKFLILEDIDFHLKSRNEGNHSLYSLLSVSSGLLSNCITNKKIILSTNLPNIRDIDDALLRPGRCFEVLNTKHLTKDEAKVVAKLINKKLPEKKKYSLAEIYNC